MANPIPAKIMVGSASVLSQNFNQKWFVEDSVFPSCCNVHGKGEIENTRTRVFVRKKFFWNFLPVVVKHRDVPFPRDFQS